MTEEHSAAVQSMGDLADPPKRRRTPSQYASQIDDFKNVLLLPCRTSPPRSPKLPESAPPPNTKKTTSPRMTPDPYPASCPTAGPTP